MATKAKTKDRNKREQVERLLRDAARMGVCGPTSRAERILRAVKRWRACRWVVREVRYRGQVDGRFAVDGEIWEGEEYVRHTGLRDREVLKREPFFWLVPHLNYHMYVLVGAKMDEVTRQALRDHGRKDV